MKDNINYAVDLDAKPFLPEDWKGVEKHKKGGVLKIEKRSDGTYLNGRKTGLYLSDIQKSGKYTTGRKLSEELKGKLTPNVNLLDFWLIPENQHLIPGECKGVHTFFLDTTYIYSFGDSFLRFLYWNQDRECWRWAHRWVEARYGNHDFTLLLIS